MRCATLAVLVSLAAALLLYAATAALPFFSETYTHLQTAHQSAFADCFDPARIPLRPVQHAWFWLWDRTGATPPVARLPGTLVHAASGALVFVLARQLGASARAALAASVCFVAFPNVKSLVWVAAVGWPWRVCLALAGLCVLLRHQARPAWWTGPAWLGAFLLALACNQGAFVLPVLGALAVAGCAAGDASRLLRSAWFLASLMLAGLYVFYLGVLRPPVVHQPVTGAVLATNVAKASLALVPADLRVLVVEWLRGTGTARALGLCSLAALGLLAGLWWWRSPRVVRCLLLAIPIELAPAMVVTGFVPRYAYLGAALLALALVLAAQHARTWRTLGAVAVALLGLAWARDHVHDVLEYRRAGAAVTAVVAEARAARARAGEGTPIVVVDPPTFLGREGDLPVFDWGLPEAMAWHGIAGQWQVVVTHGPSWLSGVEHVAPQDLERRLQGATVLRLAPDAH